MMMPRLDGVGATAEIRRLEVAAAAAGDAHASEAAPRTPIVALTANALSGDERRCFSAGMDGFLRKPIRADELLTALEAHTQWRRPAGTTAGGAAGSALSAHARTATAASAPIPE
eukprot:tig00020562_g11148.t1